MPKYGNTVFYDFKSRFFFIFSSNYRHALVLKIPFPSHIFPKISKYRTKNLHFPFTSIYYAPPPPPIFPSFCILIEWYIPPLIFFSTINNISVSVKRSNFTLVFFKAACHANPRAQTFFCRNQLIYFKTHIFQVLKYII